MRNLKRVLSLALAAVMLMGMMIVGTSAANVSDFTDSEKITNLEAASVTTAIGVFSGYGDGSFGAERYVNRAEMATIICKILRGANVNADIFKGIGKFQDLAGYEWAEGYINMCASQGIVNGTSATTYDPSRPVKTWEAALMLQRALGWWAANDPANSTISEITVTSKANGLSLYGDLVLSADAYLTRNDVAEMVFNAITKNVPVAYNESFGLYRNATSTNFFSGVSFDYRESLAYTTFGLAYRPTVDVFGRTATSWGYGTGTWNASTQTFTANRNPYKELTVVPKDAVLSYNNSVRNSTIYSDLGLSSTTTCDLYVDGVYSTIAIARNSSTMANTGRGVQTLVYANPVGSARPYTVVIINTYIMGVNTATPAKGNTPASVTVGELATATANQNYPAAGVINGRYITDAFEKDDVVLVTMAVEDHNAPTATNKYAIQSMKLADSVEGTLTAYSNTNGTATVGGTVYDFAAKKHRLAYDYITDNGRLKDEVVVYLDNYGNAMEIQAVDQEVNTSYALVLAVDADTSSVFERNNAWVKMLLMDGSIVTGKFTWSPSNATGTADQQNTGKNGTLGYYDLTKGTYKGGATQVVTKGTLYTDIQQIVTYSVNNDGIYTLYNPNYTTTRAKTMTGLQTGNNQSKVLDASNANKGFLNAASVLVVALDKSKDQYQIFTGVKDIPTVTIKDTSTHKYVENAVVTELIDVIYTESKITATSNDMIYLVKPVRWTNDQRGPYVTYAAIVNGEETELDLEGKLVPTVGSTQNTVELSTTLAALVIPANPIFRSMVVDDDIVTDLTPGTSGTHYQTGTGFIRASRNVIGVVVSGNDKYYTWSEDLKVVYIDKNNAVSTPSITSIQTDRNVTVYFNTADDNAGEIVWIYIIENETPAGPVVTPPIPTTKCQITVSGRNISVVYDEGEVDITEVAQAISAKLIEEGYTNPRMDVAGTISNIKAEKNGVTVNFTLNDTTFSTPATKEDVAALLNPSADGADKSKAPLINYVTPVEAGISEDGEVVLTGKVTPVAKADETDTAATTAQQAALQAFADADHKAYSAFEDLYDLQPGTWGFVTVTDTEGDTWVMLVGIRKAGEGHGTYSRGKDGDVVAEAGELGIVLRYGGETVEGKVNGAVTYLSTWETANGALINVADLEIASGN